MDVFGTDLVTVTIVVAVISALGSVAWLVLIIWLGMKAVRSVGRQVGAQVVDLERLIRQAQQAPAGNGVALRPDIAIDFARAQQDLVHIDRVARQRYDLRMAELQGMAASAGIDVRL